MKKQLVLLLVLPLFMGISVAHAEVGGTITKTITSQATARTISTQSPQFRILVNSMVVTILKFFEWKSGDTTLNFTSTNYSFNAGCNTIFGTYAVDGKRVAMSMPASTLMACQNSVMEKETQLSKDLSQIKYLSFSQGKLVLWGDNNTVLFFSPVLPK